MDDEAQGLRNAMRKMMLRNQFLEELDVRKVVPRITDDGYMFVDDKTPATLYNFTYYTNACAIFDATYDDMLASKGE